MGCDHSKIVRGRRSAATQGFLYVVRQIKNSLLNRNAQKSDLTYKERVTHFFLWLKLIIGIPRVYASLEVKASWNCAEKWAKKILVDNAGFKGVFCFWMSLNYVLYLFKWYLYENELSANEAQHAYVLLREKIIPSLINDNPSTGLFEVKKIYDTGIKRYDWCGFLASSGCLFDENVCKLLSALLCVNNDDIRVFSTLIVDFCSVARGEQPKRTLSIQKIRYNVQKFQKELRDWLEVYCEKLCAYAQKTKDVPCVQKWYMAKQLIWRIRAKSPCPENDDIIEHLISDFCCRANEAGALTCALRVLSLVDLSSMPADTLTECRARAAYFKECIEKHDVYRLITDMTDERSLQLMFKIVWCGTKNDVNRECANGRGQCDYAISCGADDKTIVEIKLGSNSSLLAGLKKQLAIYEDVNNTTKGIYLVVCKNASELRRCRRYAKRCGLQEDVDIYIIDASPKLSTSNVK